MNASQPTKRCAACRFYIYKTKHWGDCAHTVIPIRLQGKQHHENGTNCPAFAPREVAPC